MDDPVAAEIEDSIIGYLDARKRLLEVAERHPELLKGNDNIVGTRIGEYIAMRWLQQRGRGPAKVGNITEKGYDLLDGKTRISVKTISDENRTRRTTRLTEPWDELLVVHLETDVQRYRVGWLLRSKFDEALAEHPAWSRWPYVKLTMLGGKGLIGVYGEVSGFVDITAHEHHGKPSRYKE